MYNVLERGFINGKEPVRNFTDNTVLRNQPMSPDEISNIRRCFRLYTKLPEKYPLRLKHVKGIPTGNRELFAELVEISWSEEELSHKPREM